MPTTSAILWFKSQFGAKLQAGIAGTPFSIDMLTAIACQETGYIWQTLSQKNMPVGRILELCVGDTLDASKGRTAFPKTKAELLARPNGVQMFAIARKDLEDMAAEIPSYQAAVKNKDKFCHGFGIFQYDLQFFLTDPQYFLQRRYTDFEASLAKCVAELKNAQKRAGYEGRTKLTDLEMAYVAIAYNRGSFKPALGLKQGYYNGKRYYGEEFFDFLRLSKTVAIPGGPPLLVPAVSGKAVIELPTIIENKPLRYEVDVQADPLKLRSDASVDSSRVNKNVIAYLPDGQIVQAISAKKTNGFLEVETSVRGAYYRGFAAAGYLKPVPGAAAIAVSMPAEAPPVNGIKAVYMPRKEGSVTRRTQPAGPHSLNEPGQPARTGTTAEALRASIHTIIKWLAVDKPTHVRYQPTGKSTFCNIYAHDFCHLAGVYLPRVWWTQTAIEQLAQGKEVQPQYGATIDEERANDLFRWLRDFGLRFGWRQTGTLTKLQTEVNMGGIGLIVARRKNDGLAGHIVPVVPERADASARRNAAGEVVAPLQSQAGSTNFQYGTGRPSWWTGEEFAESAFWIHA